MNKTFLTFSLILSLIFILNIDTVHAQFQTFPQTERHSISGEKVKVFSSGRKARKTDRYIDNGGKKKQVKTKRLFVRKHGVSNYHIYSSSKATKRNRLLNKRRRKLS